MEQEGMSSSGPVTVLLARTVKPDRTEDFEAWARGMNLMVKGFEGYLGTDILRPRDHAHPEYVIVVRFDGYEHLRRWCRPNARPG